MSSQKPAISLALCDNLTYTTRMDTIDDYGCTSLAWTPWLRMAREAAKFWGLRRVPIDLYREQFAMGLEPEKAIKQIVQVLDASS